MIGRYPIGVLANSKQADLATEFVVFVLSPAGQAALAKWGFEPGGGSD